MPTLYLTGTSPGAGQTLSLEALERLRLCGAVVWDTAAKNALAKRLPGVSEVVLPRHDARGTARAAFARLREGLDVAVVATGNPFLFSDVGAAVSRACERAGFAVVVLPMQCSLDAVLCAASEEISEHSGLTVATYDSLAAGRTLDPAVPALVLCVDRALKEPRCSRRLREALAASHGEEHEILAVRAPDVRRPVKLRDWERAHRALPPQTSLFVPPAAERKRAARAR